MIFAASCFMNLTLDPNIAGPQLLVPDVIRAVGQALVMVPLSAAAMVGITQEEAGDASGLFNMMRNLGGAIGTAVLETYFTKREQYHSFIINAHVSPYDPATQTRLAALQHYFLANGSAGPAAAMARAVNVVGAGIKAQSTVMGYADCFGRLGAILVLSAAFVALLKRGSIKRRRRPKCVTQRRRLTARRSAERLSARPLMLALGLTCELRRERDGSQAHPRLRESHNRERPCPPVPFPHIACADTAEHSPTLL
jgi:hypothetical protein